MRSQTRCAICLAIVSLATTVCAADIDHIVQSNVTTKEFAMRLKIEHRYLHLPVKNGAEKIAFEFLRDGRMVREFDIELALDKPDWWAFYDVAAFKGKEIVIRTKGKVPEQIADKLAGVIKQGDDIIGAENLYREPLRPQFHFTSRRGWNNDPNGMVYHDGEYHLFYQHNPFGIKWGNMHWGHAVSADMIHWKELPIALYQNSLKDMAYSGGGAVDRNNTAGFKTGKDDVIVVSFTSTGRGECIAYSNDRGRTFTDYEGNPIVKHRGRDPKIVWFGPQNKWVLVLYDEVEDRWRYAFHESKDLKSWRYMSAVDGFYECPDFFELPVDGDTNNRKWVLYGAERREEAGKRVVARSSYMIGAFDGHAFTPETGILTGHLGPNYYAAQSFSNAPGGRCVMMGWLCGATYPNMPFSQGMTVPLELSLRTTPEGIRLFFTPVRELDALHTRTHRGADLTVEAANRLVSQTSAELLDLRADVSPADFTLTVRGIPIVYNAAKQELSCRGKEAKLSPINGAIRLHVLVDRGVLELYGNGGLVGMSFGGAIYSDGKSIHLSGAPAVRIRALEIHEMASAWQ